MDTTPILCPEIRIDNQAGWGAIEAAFGLSPAFEYRQHWRKGEHDPLFRTAAVRTGWQGGDFLIYAVLGDDDAFNKAGQLNAYTWEMGDVFEIFLMPLGRTVYVEYHVTPENQKLQLRWPDRPETYKMPEEHKLEDFMLAPEIFFSRTSVEPVAKRWRIFCRVPFGSVANEPLDNAAGTQWKASFCRYDAYRSGEISYSSTSPHEVLRYHRPQEWPVIQCVKA